MPNFEYHPFAKGSAIYVSLLIPSLNSYNALSWIFTQVSPFHPQGLSTSAPSLKRYFLTSPLLSCHFILFPLGCMLLSEAVLTYLYPSSVSLCPTLM